MLVSAAETLLSAFGYTQEKLWEVIYGVRQRELPVNS